MNTVKRRPYLSPRRRGQAEETRRRILTVARSLFVERGYGTTTIEAIAESADVSPQTVYAGFASKRGILSALLDQMAADADLPRLNKALAAAAGNPRQQLRARIAFTTRFFARGIDLIEIARTVSGVEPDLAAMWNEGEGRRHRAWSTMIAGWERTRAIPPGVTAREAVDLLWALSGPDVFRLLVVERRWSRRRFEEWLFAMAERTLLGAPGKT